MIGRMAKRGKGAAFTARDFAALGNRAAIDQALARLCRAGTIVRVRRGVYERPVLHPRFGQLAPELMEVVAAEMRSRAARWSPSGAYAANILGVSDQVPARMIILTDGRQDTFDVGRTKVLVRRTSARNLLGAGTRTGLAFQALRHLGKAHADGTVVRKLRSALTSSDRRRLVRLMPSMPTWMHGVVKAIATEAGE